MVFELKERKKKTRVVCTIGPASENEKMLRKLILAGMNVRNHHERSLIS